MSYASCKLSAVIFGYVSSYLYRLYSSNSTPRPNQLLYSVLPFYPILQASCLPSRLTVIIFEMQYTVADLPLAEKFIVDVLKYLYGNVRLPYWLTVYMNMAHPIMLAQ